MKFDFTKPEIDFNFRKESVKFEKLNWLSIFTKSINKIILLSSGISLTSLFFLINNISFQQQLEFINQPKFSVSLFLFYSLYLVGFIIKETLSTACDDEIESNKFSSIWTPINMVFSILFFLQINIDGSSYFSKFTSEIIHLLQKFF